MPYKTEKEFLKNYDVKAFKQLSITTDILVLSVSEEETSNYRKTSKKMMSILLVKREDYPFKDKWCLPGGFLNPDKETLEECAKRVLKSETNLDGVYIEQLYTLSSLNRDPRTRVLSTSFVSLIDKNMLNNNLSKNASWFDITLIEEKQNKVYITLDNGETVLKLIVKRNQISKTSNLYDYEIVENESLAFDHPIVIVMGIERVRNKLNYTDIAFHLMPEYFTLGDLQQVYEVILGKKLIDPAFRRIIKNKVIKTNKMKTGEGHRPSVLFKYNKNTR